MLKCIDCGSTVYADPHRILCEKCGGLYEVDIRFKRSFSWDDIDKDVLSIWRYRRFLPVPNDIKPVSMGEGCTPIVEAYNLPDIHEPMEVYVKFEGSNPTGSFKDRGMSVAVSLASKSGLREFIVASTGNTSASASAYASRIGGKCVVLIPYGRIARGKLAQAILHGAVIYEVKGTFDDILDKIIRLVSDGYTPYPLNSINPWRLEGQKTISYEIAEFMDWIPDYVFVPVGNAGNIYAIGKGFLELYRLELIDKLPKLIGVQASGAAPLSRLWNKGINRLIPVDNPDTSASAIRIGNPVNWKKALKIVKDLGGCFIDVDDDEILHSQRIMARYLGIGSEPAGAASLAGLYKMYGEGLIERGSRIVCIATGHALKDPDISMRMPVARKVVEKHELLNVLTMRG